MYARQKVTSHFVAMVWEDWGKCTKSTKNWPGHNCNLYPIQTLWKAEESHLRPSPYLSISAFVGEYRQIPADRFQTLVERNNRNEGYYSSRLMYRSDVISLSLVLLAQRGILITQAGAPLILNFILPKLTFLIFLCVSAETEPHEGKRKVESLWPIFRLHHQRSRYIFDLFYKRKAISRGRQSFHSSCRTN